MKFKYNHLNIEKKWKKLWYRENIFKFNPFSNKKPFYVLDMFPYPSGKGLHVGHPRGYTASDIYARWKKMMGFEIIHPIGWDAFGLPTEQYAINTNKSPFDFTLKNINKFRSQLKEFGFSFDFDIELNTSQPEYFKWTQWIFTKMYENNLVYSKLSPVNWCEKLGTVLANEEIEIIKGKAFSSIGKFPVIIKNLKQWNIKATAFADELLLGLETLDWPQNIKNEQINWIGRRSGFLTNIKINGNDYELFVDKKTDLLKISGILISYNSKIIGEEEFKRNFEYYNKIKNLNNLERLKTSNKKLFINKYCYINNYKFPIFVSPSIFDSSAKGIFPFFQNAKKSDKNRINREDLKKIKFKKFVFYKMRDWIFSRQRFWGEPFPFYYDDKDNIFIDKKIPLELPKTWSNNSKMDNHKTPLENIKKWYFFENNNKKYHRDKNVMPQWAGSCWYYIGYLLVAISKFKKRSINLYDEDASQIFNKFLPVNLYIGGKEHTVTHLIYARIWHKFLYNLGIVKTKEPFLKLINQGMILGKNNQKMSKSLGNVINPDELIIEYGADSIRLYEMYLGPLISNQSWDNNILKSMRKWIDRFYILVTTFIDTKEDNLNDIFFSTINNVTKYIKKFKFNLCISELMVFVNHCYLSEKRVNKEKILKILIISSPFIPFVTEELWHLLSEKDFLYFQKWPKSVMITNNNKKIKIPTQINGKLRKVFVVNRNISKEEYEKIIFKNDIIIKYLKNKKIKKIIFIKNKIMNIVV